MANLNATKTIYCRLADLLAYPGNDRMAHHDKSDVPGVEALVGRSPGAPAEASTPEDRQPQGSSWLEKADRAHRLLRQLHPRAGQALGEFLTWVEATPPEVVEEVYTSTFDLSPTCSPYVGYHLFGESYKRGAFLVKLQETLRAQGIEPGGELPDHVTLLLRLLARLEDGDLAADLRAECLVPALSKMRQGLGAESANPYRKVIDACLAVLDDDS